MNKRPKSVPKFTSEAAERAFWEKNDSTAYLDWKKAQPTAVSYTHLDVYKRQIIVLVASVSSVRWAAVASTSTITPAWTSIR